jgi:tubulin-specific chaperone cofactor E-like protein
MVPLTPAATAATANPPTSPPPPPPQALQLHGSGVSSWADVDALSQLPALRALRFGGCPLTAPMSAAEARAITIARLPGLAKVGV